MHRRFHHLQDGDGNGEPSCPETVIQGNTNKAKQRSSSRASCNTMESWMLHVQKVNELDHARIDPKNAWTRSPFPIPFWVKS